jgi:hypothetical protein
MNSSPQICNIYVQDSPRLSNMKIKFKTDLINNTTLMTNWPGENSEILDFCKRGPWSLPSPQLWVNIPLGQQDVRN